MILLIVIGFLFIGNSRKNFDDISGFDYFSGLGSINILVTGVRNNDKFSINMSEFSSGNFNNSGYNTDLMILQKY